MKIRVLLIDDEKEFIDVLAERLDNRGFSVLKALDGDEGLRLVRENDVDVVVLDVLMPGKDGVTTLREIKAVKPLVEVIMFTGNATVETAVKGMEMGAFDYLMKPTESKDLIEKIVNAYVRKSEQEQRIRSAEIKRILLMQGQE